jgi:hypothetical protein
VVKKVTHSPSERAAKVILDIVQGAERTTKAALLQEPKD